ncbi:MAG TPA: sn-glycerol-3-phosphate ABC transporter ATP-binding protein UgpC, partial [Nocardioides sp.]|nr:sn-glycerol-3-phosphate ABC transporter ATP-binding protein UgpC [Nocardioides sp.]
MANLALENINKVYENGFHAVQDLSIEVEDGEFLVLVGPSGCGKSTALRMVAGLEDISTGELRIAGKRVNDVDPQGRDIAMVFQSYALYPHMSVADNMAYGLKLRKMPKGQINERVNKAAEMLELTHLLDRKPKQLSGGQRQRVAMGRSIVREPQVFLMDEPLSNLDAKLRVQMRAEISAVVRALNTTTMYVTHDQTEAMTMGDRMAVMKAGILQQLGTPSDCYDSPHNIFVAQFVGSPPMNLVTADINQGSDGLELAFGGSTLQIPAAVFAARPGLRNYIGRTVALGVRSEDMEDATLRPGPPGSSIKGTVNLTEALGSEIVVHFTFPGQAVVTEDTKLVAEDHAEGQLHIVADKGVRWVASFAPRSRVRMGDDI